MYTTLTRPLNILLTAILTTTPLAGCDGGGLGIPGLDDTRARVPAKTPALEAIPTAVLPGVAGEPDMRVRLRDAATTARVGVTPGDTVWATDTTRPAAALRSPVAVALSAEGWTLTDAAGIIARYPRTAQLELAPERDMLSGGGGGTADRSSGVLARSATSSGLAPKMTLEGGRFGGKFRLLARPDTTPRSFDVIEQVGVEEYLKGVVAAEMWSQWPIEAFCVQAVCARSYALHERAQARSLGKPYDVESTVKDQAYKGAVDSGGPAEAVTATQGVVLSWGGQVLRAYYSSTSGGRPASARDTWPITRGYEYNLAGPLQAVGPGASGERDATLGSASPYFRWQVARSRQEALSRIREWGKRSGHPVASITSIASISQSGANAAGRPTRFVIVSSGGQRTELTAEQLRFAFNQEAAGSPAVTRATRVNSGDMEVSIVGDVVNIKGRGFGHGVGMCQYSVKELADKGKPWQEIAPMFYPGATLVRAY